MENSNISIENLKRQLNLITNAFELDDNACIKGKCNFSIFSFRLKDMLINNQYQKSTRCRQDSHGTN